jgi:hypothetical protein
MRSLVLCGLLLVLGCSADKPTEPAQPEAPASARARFVRVERPRDRSLLEAPAIARADPASSGEVSALTRLSIRRVLVQVGERVEAGQAVLEVLAPQVLEAAASYVSAATQKGLHEQRAVELEALRADGLATKSEVLQETMLARSLAAEQLRSSAVLLGSGVALSDAGRLLNSGQVTLRAPVAGVVSELSARPGTTYDGAQVPLLRIVGTAAARIEIRSSASLPAFRRASFVAIDGRSFELENQPLSSVVAPGDGTVTSWYELVGRPPLPDGLRGTVRLVALDDAWEVPAFALSREGSQNVVLRRRQGREEKVPVDLLAAAGTSAWVRGALAADDEVAADYAATRTGAEVAQ